MNDTPSDDDINSKGPLTQDELHAIRRIIRDEARARWLRGQLRVWVAWAIGAPVALVAAWQAASSILDFFKKLVH
jgi:hypothetical protein